MNVPHSNPLVSTIREHCRVCYTCVRECPAKAIRINEGQAQVLPERCIGCGNCVRVCSQHAKRVQGGIEPTEALLAGERPVAAIVAPSFPAEFTDITTGRLVGQLRAMGFARVCEVAFGADLVARAYRDLLANSGPDARFIATSCPAIVGYVERYHPELIGALAPIVSPMVATARALRQLHGPALRVVFIGPCIAKKGEQIDPETPGPGEVDAVLTFVELREMILTRRLHLQAVEETDFDEPHGGAGALFSISRGLLQAANIQEDLLAGDVVTAAGRQGFVEALKEFADNTLDARLLEVLCCDGCIMGAGVSNAAPLFKRRSRVSQYVRERLARLDPARWQQSMDQMSGLDLSRRYIDNDQRIPVPFEEEVRQIMARMGKRGPEDELNCGACGYDTCYDHAVAIFKGLAEIEMCLPHTIEHLRKAIQELAVSNDQLASTQAALMHSEKLASMGQLAAGIAHEVNNPLGVVLMYAHLLLEEAGQQGHLRDDLSMIAEQADRCKKIVAGLLHFARQNKVVLQATDLADLARRALRTLQAPDDVEVRVEADPGDLTAEVDRDQIVQVLTNLATNAFAAMPDGGMLTLSVEGSDSQVRLRVRDTGVGIVPENLAKIFEPFFTTKQIGKGTGLGLAVTYGIVKMHRGDITVESNADPSAGPTGTSFTVVLPRTSPKEPERLLGASEESAG